MKPARLGFGDSCHWCTEAFFQSLRGITLVRQGWISSGGLPFSEAVLIDYDQEVIDLENIGRRVFA